MLPHTCNPVNSQTLNASYANSWRENSGVMPSISSGFENTLVCGVGAVLSPVHIARFNVGIHLIMNDIWCWEKYQRGTWVNGKLMIIIYQAYFTTIRSQHTSANRHHSFRVVRAVYVEATDIWASGDNGERFILLAAGAIWRWVKPCSAGTGLLIVGFGQTEVRTAAVVGAAGISGSCWVWGGKDRVAKASVTGCPYLTGE